jgi:hypothetical protein
MKISVDITPEEMRTLMGWPDVQGLHEEMINKIREQMNAAFLYPIGQLNGEPAKDVCRDDEWLRKKIRLNSECRN